MMMKKMMKMKKRMMKMKMMKMKMMKHDIGVQSSAIDRTCQASAQAVREGRA